MAIRNYWWLLIWAFLFGGIAFAFIPKQEEYVLGRRVVRWNWLPALILIAPYVIWAGWRTTSWGDTSNYIWMFEAAPASICSQTAPALDRLPSLKPMNEVRSTPAGR